MEICEFQTADRSEIISLMDEFGIYLEKMDPMDRTSFAPNGSVYFTDKLIEECNKHKGKIFVAKENNHIIGFIGGHVSKQDEEELMEAKKAVPGVITEFFITQKLRNKGVGSTLFERMEKHLKNEGCTLIKFDVFAPNILARNFYKKHGYQDRSVIMSKDI